MLAYWKWSRPSTARQRANLVGLAIRFPAEIGIRRSSWMTVVSRSTGRTPLVGPRCRR